MNQYVTNVATEHSDETLVVRAQGPEQAATRALARCFDPRQLVAEMRRVEIFDEPEDLFTFQILGEDSLAIVVITVTSL